MRILLALALSLCSSAALADNLVNGYTRQNGTYVQPHYQTNPDANRFNNYSTQGNTNPYTGRQGTVDPYATSNTNNYFGKSRNR